MSPAEAQHEAFHACLFGRAGAGRLSLDALAGAAPGEDSLLWVDLLDPGTDLLDAVWRALRLPAPARAFLEGGTNPALEREAGFFWVRVVAVDGEADPAVGGNMLALVAGPNLVVSIRRGALAFIEALRQRDGDAPDLGALCAESFVAALLDGQLSTYFREVTRFEAAIERLEVGVLEDHSQNCLGELRRLRRWASRLRRMLAPHRDVFGALSRPDFRAPGTEAERHFAALDTRFERAMDLVENARELVIGSFDLFSSQTALQTHRSMRLLTFVTVITGLLATVAGVFGMNFQAGVLESADAGFWGVVAGMALFAGGAIALGRWRRWI